MLSTGLQRLVPTLTPSCNSALLVFIFYGHGSLPVSLPCQCSCPLTPVVFLLSCCVSLLFFLPSHSSWYPDLSVLLFSWSGVLLVILTYQCNYCSAPKVFLFSFPSALNVLLSHQYFCMPAMALLLFLRPDSFFCPRTHHVLLPCQSSCPSTLLVFQPISIYVCLFWHFTCFSSLALFLSYSHAELGFLFSCPYSFPVLLPSTLLVLLASPVSSPFLAPSSSLLPHYTTLKCTVHQLYLGVVYTKSSLP